MRVAGIDARAANEARRAGIGNYALEAIRALGAAPGDWRPRLYVDRAPGAALSEAAAGMEIRRLPPGRLWTQRQLARELRRDPPDVYYTASLQAPLRCPAPIVATVHDLAFLGFPEHFTWRRRFSARLQARQVIGAAARLVADSEATRADILRYYRIPAARVSVGWAGAGAAFRPAADPAALAAFRARLGLPERYVLYVGRLQPRKNIARLVAAFSEAVARRPSLPHRLVIAGAEGWLHAGIHAAAADSAARERIQFLGFVDEADLPGLYQAAEAFALVSLWEGFGLPALEAMACGTAVITSNCSSLPEVAGDAALLVDPEDTGAIADGLERLMTDEALRARLAAAGPARAARFSWAATARVLVAAFDAAVEDTTGERRA